MNDLIYDLLVFFYRINETSKVNRITSWLIRGDII